MERLQTRRQKIGSRIFAVGESTRLETVTDLWRRKVLGDSTLGGRRSAPLPEEGTRSADEGLKPY
jgi:hypothetical protein